MKIRPFEDPMHHIHVYLRRVLVLCTEYCVLFVARSLPGESRKPAMLWGGAATEIHANSIRRLNIRSILRLIQDAEFG